MMEFMRKYAAVIITIAVVGFIGSLVIGANSNSRAVKAMTQPVGTVGGDVITRIEFTKAYNKAQSNLRDNELSDKERSELPMRVWEQLVSEKITQRIAKEMKLDATPDEILQSLLNNPPKVLSQSPYFADKNGRFDKAKYQEIMIFQILNLLNSM
jgi:hypothetical protein